MKKSTAIRTLLLTSLAIFTLEIWLGNLDCYFQTDSSYKSLIQANHILKKGVPDFSNREIVNGRTTFFPPLFEYVLALFILLARNKEGPTILNSLMLAIIPILIYLLAKELQRKHSTALLSALLGGFVPILWSSSTNTTGKLPFVVALTVLSTITYTKALKNKKKSLYFYISFILLCATSPVAVLFLIGIFLNMILTYTYKRKTSVIEHELIAFASSIYLFSVLILYNTFFFGLGEKIFWLNTPSMAQQPTYSDFNLLQISASLGIFPMLYGIWIIYRTLTHSKSTKDQYLTTALALASLFLLWLKIIPWNLGVSILGVFFAAQFSLFLNRLEEEIRKSKFANYHNIIYGLLIAIFLAASVIPAISFGIKNARNPEITKIKEAFTYLREKTPENAQIVIDYNKGYTTYYYTHRKVFLTNFFMAIKEPKERLKEFKRIYTEHFETNAREILDKYNLSYVVVDPSIKNRYGVKGLQYAKDSPYIKAVYKDENTTIYRYQSPTPQLASTSAQTA